MQKIVLATGNKGKTAELQELLEGLPIELITQTDLNIANVEETGFTFVENAILKARNASRLSGLPALADDSGLSVDCLGGAPGVFSARYAGAGAKDSDLIAKLLKEMQTVDCENRKARFHCALVLFTYPADPAPIICQGVWEGEILPYARGRHGFGYDPVFYVPSHDCTAAEMDPSEKNRIGHRGRAMDQLLEILRESGIKVL